MTYSLHRLAAGSYDLLLDGNVVGSVVREVTKGGDVRGWHAELLRADLVIPPPFTSEAHRFGTLEDVTSWLGGARTIEWG